LPVSCIAKGDSKPAALEEKENPPATYVQIVYKKAIKGHSDWAVSSWMTRSRLRLGYLSSKLVGSLGRFYWPDALAESL
jgi:hypothetical protein